MPTDDYWRRRREKMDAYWDGTREIRRIDAKARQHAAKARALANKIEAKQQAERHKPGGQPRSKG